ncbi:hypothetical protein CERZMDRAFT_110214 [Cercospora zeae-maydis SCOH1-5]|uniref:ferric-chelate reductase (NADPH) n=1 Tax=Cercospora zeae-maydis SCOH1-5 TaxID=717836 RepID=A0A6A6FMK1_9PEZI|nr:hypothetical protein CERZMDRAFT_110214 [Cercospora zeae-maydis SCOH1-5]
MYKFVDLSKEQQHERRELLDFYGLAAQCSIILPLFAIGVLHVASTCRRLWPRGTLETPASPYVKAVRKANGLTIANVQNRWRRAAWWSGDPVHVFGYHVGTKGEMLWGTTWTVWLLVLTFLDTGDDYLHLTKRFGTVGGSQLPFHYLLSLKSPWAPMQILTGFSEASLLSAHQILGRIIVGFFWAHVALYVNFYVVKSLLLDKLQNFIIICGIVAIISFTALSTTALKAVRDRSYRIFYITHVSLATCVLPLLYWHVEHIRPFIYETVVIYMVNAVLRFLATRKRAGTIKQVRDAGLVEISLPLAAGAMKWHPGQHAYVSVAGNSFLRTFKTNPFTCASIPAIDNKLRFVARILDGNTAKLAKIDKETQNFSVEGPYGLASHVDRLLGYDRVLFVAGGVGATFVAPLYRQLLSDLSPSKGSHRRQKVSFVWAARTLSEVTWALPEGLKEREGFTERLTVHLSRQDGGQVEDSSFVLANDDDEGPGDEGIEMEEQKKLLHEGAEETASTTSSPTHGIHIANGRPDLATVVDQVFMQSSTERVAVVVCGPAGLSQSLRRHVGRWVGRGRDVWYWNEAFAL